jgi:glycine/D-amino acid oxidase-like deaminating enzyme
MMSSYDVAVVGGGMVGAAIAYGLAKRGSKVAMLDEGDIAFRAARGNFGLVWVQGKGLDFPAYAELTRLSSELWVEFAEELETLTGVNLSYIRDGGFELCVTEADLAGRAEELERLQQQSDGEFRYEMLDGAQLRKEIPQVSERLAGAAFCPLDAHLSPLYLLRALHHGFIALGGSYLPGRPVEAIETGETGFTLRTAEGPVAAERLVLAAGLGNLRLAPMVGLNAPVTPNRGQILVTERVEPFLRQPTIYMRQTGEGSLLLGDSHEDVGLNDGTTGEVMAAIAKYAVTCFPFLERVRPVRAWGALRVMTPDGAPIYDRAKSGPGAFVACCHSGVTLAAAHARVLPDWIAGEQPIPRLADFTAERFDVQAVA